VIRPLVLIAEDDPALRSVLTRGLIEDGMRPHAVATGAELLDLAASEPAAVTIIDIGLPDSDGRDVCQAMRARGIATPVIFLTARDALVDRLAGFEAGGDDYLIKPFALHELIARLRALIRRAGAAPSSSDTTVMLDPASHGLRAGAGRVPLTPTEFRVLATLWARPGEAVRRRELIRTGWPAGAIVNDNTLDAYILRLRRKLRQIPDAPAVETVHGVGYLLKW
jgi:two-component system, OmpR family, response regulator